MKETTNGREEWKNLEVAEILKRMDVISSMPSSLSAKADLELGEWSALRQMLDTTKNLLTHSSDLEEQMPGSGYAFDMGIGYAKLHSLQSKLDRNLSAVIRTQPIPKETRDFAYNTKGKTISLNQIHKVDIMLSLRQRLSAGSWAVANLKFAASPDFGVLVADPQKIDDLNRLGLATDFRYFGAFKPFYMLFWGEKLKDTSDVKEMMMLISSAENILSPSEAKTFLKEFTGEFDSELEAFWKNFQGGKSVSEIGQFLKEVARKPQYLELVRALANHLKDASSYQLKALPSSVKLFDDINLELTGMVPKKIQKTDLLPAESLVDIQSEELKAFESR